MKRLIASAGSLLLAGALSVVLPTVAPAPADAYVSCAFSPVKVENAPIPDLGSATFTSDLSGLTTNDTLHDLDVSVSITHPFVQDIVLDLSFGGHTVRLINRRGGDGDNLTNTRFNDGAATPIGSGSAPYTGHFRPEQSLNAFDGLNPSGVWTLKVADTGDEDIGTIQHWSLHPKTQWCDDFDRDLVKDAYDQCPESKGVPPHGCPVRARTATILYRPAAGEFRGKVSCASASDCHVGQPVRIYKVASGKDSLVGRGFTNATGNYAIPKGNVSGRYYAVAPTVVEEGVAECKRAQSANLAV